MPPPYQGVGFMLQAAGDDGGDMFGDWGGDDDGGYSGDHVM